MTIEPTDPIIGRSDVRMPPAPSFGTSSGGACTMSFPLGTRGGASRGPFVTTCLPRAG